MASDNRKSLYIIDGSSYVFRAYYASPPLTTKEGIPTNGTLVFTNMLLALLREQKPDLVAVTFDPPGPNFRHALYSAYKANRKSAPDDLVAQLPYFPQIVEGLGIAVLTVPGYEADDVIATICDRAADTDLNVTIVSGDKDLMQLVRDGQVRMLDTIGRVNRLYTEAEVEARFLVAPGQVADVLGLAGDSSDNIPGVPGIGAKTASALVAEYGSVDEVLANIDKISGKKRKENLAEFADQARLSKQLATLDHAVPFDCSFDDMVPGEPNQEALLPLLEKLEFFRLIDDLGLRRAVGQQGMAFDVGGARETREPRQALLHEHPHEPADALTDDDLDDAPAEEVFEGEPVFDVVLDEGALVALIETLREAGRFAFELVTSRTDPVRAPIVGVALCYQPQGAVYVPVGHRTLIAPPQIARGRMLELLGPLWADPSIAVVCHDSKAAWTTLQQVDVQLLGVACDTALCSYIVDPGRANHELGLLSEELFQRPLPALAAVLGSGRKAKSFDTTEVEDGCTWAAPRAHAIWHLSRRLWAVLKRRGMTSLHDDLEVPLGRVLGLLERTGVRIDESVLAALSDEFMGEMKRLEAESEALLGRHINLNSPKQLSEILFDELGLKPASRKRTTHGFSTDQASLEQITDQHPLPELVLAYRSVSKLRSTYTDALPALRSPDTGRIHTRFNQTVAATGRLSSSEPNLQNIPVRTPQGRRIRGAFIPEPGWRLLSADYSQIELRLMAHFSKDATLIEAFRLGQDIHRRTAAEIFDVALDEVSKAQRGVGKTINFGVLYGMGVQRLARETSSTQAEAKRFMARFDERFVAVRTFFDALVADAMRYGFVSTLLGRRRYLPELNSARNNIQALGRRLAINTPIQGTAADLIKLAMIKVHARMQQDGFAARMLLQVHDELVFEAPVDELSALAAAVRQEMESVWDLTVNLAVDISSGESWADLSPFQG